MCPCVRKFTGRLQTIHQEQKPRSPQVSVHWWKRIFHRRREFKPSFNVLRVRGVGSVTAPISPPELPNQPFLPVSDGHLVSGRPSTVTPSNESMPPAVSTSWKQPRPVACVDDQSIEAQKKCAYCSIHRKDASFSIGSTSYPLDTRFKAFHPSLMVHGHNGLSIDADHTLAGGSTIIASGSPGETSRSNPVSFNSAFCRRNRDGRNREVNSASRNLMLAPATMSNTADVDPHDSRYIESIPDSVGDTKSDNHQAAANGTGRDAQLPSWAGTAPLVDDRATLPN